MTSLFDMLTKNPERTRAQKRISGIKAVLAAGAVALGMYACMETYIHAVNHSKPEEKAVQTKPKNLEPAAERAQLNRTGQNLQAHPKNSPTAEETKARTDIPYYDITEREAKKYGLNPLEMAAQQKQESRFNPNAKSPAGAIGIAQIMPATGKALGYSVLELLIPEKNIEAQARCMNQIYRIPALKKFEEGERQKLAHACYNAGYGNVRDAIKIINAANTGKTKYEIVRGKKVVRTVEISQLKGQPCDWQGISEALKLVTGRKNSAETITYVRKIKEFYTEYQNGGK